MTEAAAQVEALRVPFPSLRIRWRVVDAGLNARKKAWVKISPYVRPDDIAGRLDEVVGAANWQTKIEAFGEGERCSIGIRLDGEWVWKESAAPSIELHEWSGMPRTAALWGVGAYLDSLCDRPARVSEHRPANDWQELSIGPTNAIAYWKADLFPTWALPPKERPMIEDPRADSLRRFLMGDCGCYCVGDVEQSRERATKVCAWIVKKASLDGVPDTITDIVKDEDACNRIRQAAVSIQNEGTPASTFLQEAT